MSLSMFTRFPKLLITTLVITLIVAACSGGNSTPSTTPAPTAASTAAAAASCPQVVKAALDTVAGKCNSIGSNSICYGNPKIDVALANPDAVFKAAGDTVKISDLKTIHTAPYDAASGTWGVAVMRAAVNLPGSSAGQQVTLIMYGDTTLDGFSGDMQTVSFRSGIGNPACDQLPPSGLTVQVPHGQRIKFTVNGVDISLGSTVIMKADPNKDVSVAVLEGQAEVTAKGQTESVPAGRQVSVPLANGIPAAAPGPVQAIPIAEVQAAPVELLSEPVSITSVQAAILATDSFTPTPGATLVLVTPTSPAGTPISTITPLLTWTPAPTLAKSTAGGQNRIAYAAKQNEKWDIFVMNSDGSAVKQITTRDGDNRDPAWSPDGAHLVFAGFTGGTAQLYLVGDDGKNLTPITPPDGSADHPAWSPDGKLIAYDFLKGKNRDIYVSDTGGGNAKALASDPADDSQPTWSPDSSHIAFVTNRDNNKEIYSMSADGNNLTRLTDNAADDVSPAWSPDGKSIAFVSNRSGNDDIYVMDADGKNVMRVVSNPANDESPVWSADSKSIAFVSDRDGTQAIYVVPVSGGTAIRVSDLASDSDAPAWQH